jgi:hypothetical protein
MLYLNHGINSHSDSSHLNTGRWYHAQSMGYELECIDIQTSVHLCITAPVNENNFTLISKLGSAYFAYRFFDLHILHILPIILHILHIGDHKVKMASSLKIWVQNAVQGRLD